MQEHFNKLTAAQAERLALLLEEMGEAQQIIGKILRHGYESHHPDGGPTNRELLEKEMGDVWHALCLMWDHDLNRGEIFNHSQAKASSVIPYLHHQDRKGA